MEISTEIKPLLSIIIPTKNRAIYCSILVKNLLSFDYLNFEVVVQDNSDDLVLYDLIKNISDVRLVYNYTASPINSVDNFNLAIGLAQGEYFCMIGDDDGINPEIFSLVEWAKSHDIDAIHPGFGLMYRWPDACDLLDGFQGHNGSLDILPMSNKYFFSNPQKSLHRLLLNGGQDYLSLYFPKLYHGIVKGSLIEKIKSNFGNYVGGLSPDIYLAVSLTEFCREVFVIDYPVFISGVCRPSAQRIVSKYSNLTDSPHFVNRINYEWSIEVPRINRGSTIWADSVLAALRDAKRYNLYQMFNVFKLHLNLYDSESESRSEIVNSYLLYNNVNTFFGKFLFLIYFFTSYVVYFIKKKVKWIVKIQHKLLMKVICFDNPPLVNFKNIKNIAEANEIVSFYFKSKRIDLKSVLNNIKISN